MAAFATIRAKASGTFLWLNCSPAFLALIVYGLIQLTQAAWSLAMREIVSPISGIRSPFGREPFSPYRLFSSGEQGAWYDPSDFSTMFQDSAGTTPVTAVEQPVGLILDKSPNGKHASQTTSASRPILARQPLSGVRNLLTYTEDFSAVPWQTTTPGELTLTYGVADPLGGNTATTLTHSPGLPGNGFLRRIVDSVITAGQIYTLSFWIRKRTGTGDFNVYLGPNASNLISGITSDWQRFTLVSAPAVLPIFRVYFQVFTENDQFDFWGVQLEQASSASAYQKVVSEYDVTEAGVRSVFALDFDGTDDSLETASIDFSGSDEMSVFAGVRKDSDAAQKVVAELSATIASNDGAFLLAAPDAASATFAFDSKGTTQVDAVATGQTAPITAVLSGLSDISADACILRVNGAQADSDTGNQGTGNYGNYPLYIGRRGGSTLPLNGRLFSLIIRGKSSTASQITQSEAWVNARTGAY